MDHSLDGWPKIALDFGCMTKKFVGCLPLCHITPQIPRSFSWLQASAKVYLTWPTETGQRKPLPVGHMRRILA